MSFLSGTPWRGEALLTRRTRSMYPGGHMSRTHRSPGHSLLVALGLFVVLSHVCVLPVDATGLATLAGHTHGAHDESSSDDALHGASCEAVRSTFAATPPVLPAASTTPARLVAPSVPRPLVSRLAVVAPSPPLFLLHASLLI